MNYYEGPKQPPRSWRQTIVSRLIELAVGAAVGLAAGLLVIYYL